MDDTEPRLTAAGKPILNSQRLSSITLLADADELDLKALNDWSRGLDWVQWLLSGIRQRMAHLHFVSKSESPKALRRDWTHFAETPLRHTIAPHFLKAWETIQQSDLSTLISLDEAFSSTLTEDEHRRSLEAGRLLLKATQRASYQSMLGHYRKACTSNAAPGHFLTAWAAVAQFFQLSLASSLSEYLRLEWALAARKLPVPPELATLPLFTAQLMKSQPNALRLLE